MGREDEDEESNGAWIAMLAVMTLFAGLAGISFGVAGAIIFPFVPSTIGGSMLAVTGILTFFAAVLVLCSRNQQESAHRAVILSIFIQIVSSFAILIMAVGASHNFCHTKKPCFIEEFDGDPGDRCDKDLDGCIEDLSYFCHKLPSTIDTIVTNVTNGTNGTTMFGTTTILDLGLKNCDTTFSDRCNGGDKFWGFDDRDDCMEFYTEKKRFFRPAISKGLIIAGGVLQFAFTTLLSTALRVRF